MHFLIAGSGAVGCYFGGRLQLAGHRVSFLARGERRAALAHYGLRIAMGQDNHSLTVSFADAPRHWDIVLLCVKSWQVEEVLATLPLYTSWPGMILTTQNGVEAPGQVAALLGPEKVLAGIVHGFFEIGDDARVRHVGVPPKLMLNSLGGLTKNPSIALRNAVTDAGIASEMPDDIMASLWEKHLLSSALGGVGAFVGASVGKIRANPEWRGMIEAAMREVARVAESHDIALARDVVERNLSFIDRFPADATTSMQRDILAGRRSEFDAQTGAVIRFAEAAGVVTPVNRLLYKALLPLEKKARGG